MGNIRRVRTAVIAGVALGLLGPSAMAVDTVTRRSTGKPVAGQITKVSRTEIVVTPRVGQPVTVPANDILEVDWEGAPPSVRLGRSQERGGQLAQALRSYEQAATENTSTNSNLRTEIEYLQVRVKAKLALADPTQMAAAAETLQAFLNRNRDYYRFYEAQLLLGELGLVAENYSAADAAFATLAEAPWSDLQMAGKIGGARILFDRGDIAGAKAVFDEVAASATGDDPGAAARRLEAKLGQAKCLQTQGRHEEAVPIFDEVVRESSENDTRLQAEAYVGQGTAYAAVGGKAKEAITKFLIVDVVPSLAQHADLHAEALYQLAQLWPTVGQPARGAEASARLEQDYPNSEWTRKLSGAQ